MPCRHGLNWLCVVMFGGIGSATLPGQEQAIEAVIQAESNVDDQSDVEADDDDGVVSEEITVVVRRDGQTVTLTQTAEGDFVGEIAGDEETSVVRAQSLNELKSKFPIAHAAFLEKPENSAPKPGALANVKVQLTNENGDRKVEASELGRKITMRDRNGKQLEVTVQQDLEHGTRTARYEAPHYDALRKSHPDIAQLIKQYRDGAIGFGGTVHLRVQADPFRAAVGPRKIVGEHDGYRATILDEQGRRIRLTLVKTVAGKEEVEEFEAETYAELKKNHPRIAKIYEKLAGKSQAAVPPQVQVFGNAVPFQVQVQVQPDPAVVPVEPIPEKPMRPVRNQNLQFAKRLMQQSQRRLEELAADPEYDDADTVQELAEELAETLKKLEALEKKSKR